MNTASAPETTSPSVIRLADYQPSAFTTKGVDLAFSIYPDHTLVTSRVHYTRTDDGSEALDLILDAQDPNPGSVGYIRSVCRDGTEIS